MQRLKHFLQMPYGKGFPLICLLLWHPYEGSMRHITATPAGHVFTTHPASRPMRSDLSVQIRLNYLTRLLKERGKCQ